MAPKKVTESPRVIVKLQKEVAMLTAMVKNTDSECIFPSTEHTSKQPGKKLDIDRVAVVPGIAKYPGARAGLRLPAVILDMHFATEKTKALMSDPTRVEEKTGAVLKDNTT